MSGNHAVEQRSRVIGYLLVPVALFLFASLATYSPNDYPNSSLPVDRVLNAGGVLGAQAASTLYLLFGYGAFLLPLWVVFAAWNRWANGAPRYLGWTLLNCVCLAISFTVTFTLIGPSSTEATFRISGAAGLRLGQLLSSALGPSGAIAVSAFVLFLSLVIPVLWCVRLRSFRPRAPQKLSGADDYQIQPLSRTNSV